MPPYKAALAALAARMLAFAFGGRAEVAFTTCDVQAMQMHISRQEALSVTSPRLLQELQGACDPASVVLSESPQWEQEEGYWIGELSLFGADGNPSTSSSWNYPYDHYKGFITGNVQGNSYRQRNVFMYPPQVAAECPFPNSTGKKDGSSPVGVGVCGVNGNMKLFDADQQATTCSTNPELKGDIEGPYGSLQYTYTQLVGENNSLLYQVFITKAALNYYEAVVMGNPYGRCTQLSAWAWDCGYTDDRLMQSQLTTLTQLPSGDWLRTRTAQGFDAFAVVGSPSYASFYRERKVTEAEFWAEFNATKIAYNILDSDTCAWASGPTGGTVPSGVTPGFSGCEAHLEESFALSAAASPECTTTTPTSTTTAGVSAVGDPHMVNVFGQRFDLFQPGVHALLRIPKSADRQKSLLAVVADAQKSGGACSDIYLKSLNVSGQWVEYSDGLLQFAAADEPRRGKRGTGWMRFHSVDLKVVWGHTSEGIQYLNLLTRHLGKAGHPVGGLLGEDDHSAAAAPSRGCRGLMGLIQTGGESDSGEGAMASASFL